MNCNDIARAVAVECGLTQRTVARVVRRFVEAMANKVAIEGGVTLHGIGTIRVGVVAVGKGFRRRPSFALSPTLKSRIRLPGPAAIPTGARRRNPLGRFETIGPRSTPVLTTRHTAGVVYARQAR
jgi:Bacterial DNA-binding protein